MKSLARSVFTLALVAMAVAAVPRAARAANTNFAAGSLIIPMDTDYQDNGMLRAYGLVDKLLRAGVPINWCIIPTKVLVTPATGQFTPDFTASARDLQSNAVINAHPYRGGPFVIDQSNAAVATPIITAYQAVNGNGNTKVHVASAAFTAPVSRRMTAAPHIGIILDGYENIAYSYLNAANINDSTGVAFANGSVDVLPPASIAGATTTNHADGVLFRPSGQPAYCDVMTMHYDPTGDANAPEVAQEVVSFVQYPVHFNAECLAIGTMEGQPPVGGRDRLLTPAGFVTPPPAQPMGAVQFSNSFLPFAQMDGPFNTVAGMIPALELPANTTYYDNDVVMIRPAGDAIGVADLWMTGYAFGACSIVNGCQGNVPRGKVSYLAGHQYAVTLPISTSTTTNGARLWLNSLYETGCVSGEGQPSTTLTASAPASTSNPTVTFTIAYTNGGPGGALASVLTDKLPAGTTFVSASNGGVNNAGTVTWNLGDLPANASGTVTVTVTLNGAGTYLNSGSLGYTVGLTPFTDPSNVTTTVFNMNEPNLVVTAVAPATSSSPTITLTLDYANTGTATAQNSVITDTLPPGATFISASPGCVNNNGVVTCTLGNVAAGAMGSVSIQVLLPAFGTYPNNATGGYSDGTNTLTAPSNTTTTVYGPVTPSLQLSASAPAVTAVATVPFTITYTNNGTSTAQAVVVTDVLPAGATFVSASNGGTNNAGTVTWNVGNVLGGATAQVTVNVVLAAYGSYQNQGTATYSDGVNPLTASSNTTTTVYGPAAPSIAITVVAPTLTTSQTVVYTVNYTNNGNGAAPAFVLSDALPPGAAFVSATGGGAVMNGAVVWNLGTIPTGGSGTVSFTVTLPTPGTYKDTATAAFQDLNKNPETATSNTAVTVFTPALSLTASAPATTLVPGVTYTINYTNLAATALTNTIVTDALPNGAAFVSASNGGVFANGVVTWTLGNVPVAAMGTLTVTLTLPAPGTYPNQAQASYLLNNANQTSSSNTTSTVYQGPSVTVTKSGPAQTTNDTATYTITYANAGPGTAQALSLADPLPMGATFVSASNGGAVMNGAVVWNVGDVAGGGMGSVTVTLAFNAPGMWTNVASATFTAGAMPTTVMSNGVATSYPTPVLTLTATAPATTLSNLVTFTIAYTNGGPDTVQGVSLSDLLPPGATFVSATGGGVLMNGAVVWPVGDVPTGGMGMVTVTVMLGAYGTYMNQATGTFTAGMTTPMVMSNTTSTQFLAPAVTLTATAPAATNVPSVTFTIAYQNTGSTVASGLVITDNVPANATFSAATGGGTAAAGVVTWNVGDVQAGAGGMVTYTATLSVAGTYMNQATGNYSMTATPQTVQSNTTSTVYTVLLPPDMSMGTCPMPCMGTTPVCDGASNTCRACKSDADCAGATPACQPSGACGQCSATNVTQCGGQTPTCNVPAGQCVLCTTTGGDGGGDATGCATNTDGHACEESAQNTPFCGCNNDQDCGASDSGRICDPVARKCTDGCSPAPSRNHCPMGDFCTSTDLTGAITGVCTTACTMNGDCTTAPRLFCLMGEDDAGMTEDGGTGECVECRDNADCSTNPTKRVCSPTTNSCVVCNVVGDCAGSASGPVCLTDNNCGCNTDSDCGSATSGMACDTTVHSCVQGCRGTGGNGCPNGQRCSSTDNTLGTCGAIPADAAVPADLSATSGGADMSGGQRYGLQGGGGCNVGSRGTNLGDLALASLLSLGFALVARRRRR